MTIFQFTDAYGVRHLLSLEWITSIEVQHNRNCPRYYEPNCGVLIYTVGDKEAKYVPVCRAIYERVLKGNDDAYYALSKEDQTKIRHENYENSTRAMEEAIKKTNEFVDNLVELWQRCQLKITKLN